MINKLCLSAILILTGFAAHAEQAGEVFPTVNNAWLRAAPPGSPMLAAYIELTNPTQQAIKLVGAYSPAFSMTEIHKTIIIDDMARMREQKEIIIQPGQSVVMEPGGLHIMLMRPQQQLDVGDTVRICLIYAGESENKVQHLDFPVKMAQ
ncbi:copper chaperone PCu(A)C [Marinicella sp. W31]|uniref:copper chaperone PCu(A)C n=1 Tax=Marinicella sp. W31 TaxID=3023713 RepID=UPI0037575933